MSEYHAFQKVRENGTYALGVDAVDCRLSPCQNPRDRVRSCVILRASASRRETERDYISAMEGCSLSAWCAPFSTA